MISGVVWMLKWRSRGSSDTGLVSHPDGPPMRTIVLAVGRLRPPYADDVQHYQKLLARHTRLEQIEVREDQSVDGRIPDRAYTCLLASDGKTFDSVAFSQWLEERRQSGQDLCFIVGGPRGLDLDGCDMKL